LSAIYGYTGCCFGMSRMRVCLIRKLSDHIDGVDLTNHDVGDVIDLPERKARLLMAEGWAHPERRMSGPATVVAFRRETDPGHHYDEDEVFRAS
jgi:hypothetical protein